MSVLNLAKSNEPPRMAAAVVVSLAIHAFLIASFVGSRSDEQRRTQFSTEASLSAVLLPRPAEPIASAVLVPSGTPTDVTTVPPKYAEGQTNGEEAIPQKPTQLPRSGIAGNVSVATDVPLSRFGEAVYSRALSDFPVEIDQPAKLPAQFTVPYPRSALASKHEGSVAIWVVVTSEGVPEELHVAEGSGPLAEAAIGAIANARFVPAVNEGQAIRYHVGVVVNFRLRSPKDVEGEVHHTASAN